MSVLGAMALLSSCLDAPSLGPSQAVIDNATIKTMHKAPTETTTPGFHALGLATGRDGFFYVPSNYNPAAATPLLILLHAETSTSADWSTPEMQALYDDLGIIVLAVDSRGVSWDYAVAGEYNADVKFIDLAVEVVFRKTNVDQARIAIGGFSQGAAEAIGIGIANSGLIRIVVAFSPADPYIPFSRGPLDLFISHGTEDTVHPYNTTANVTVPLLANSSHVVFFRSFTGGHELTPDVAAEGFSYVVAH